MSKVLFETHHLYYWPNFLPIILEMKSRLNYDIYASMPIRSSKIEYAQFLIACTEAGVKTIESDSERNRINKIIKNEFSIIIVGNIGQLNQLVTSKTLAVMVYHGIGLKKSYYTDINDRINLRSVESESRYDELKKMGYENLVLTGFTKLDLLFDESNYDIVQLKKELDLDPNKKTILYAPSFYPSSIEKLVPEFISLSKEYNILIKLHSFSWFQGRYLHQSEQCIRVSKNYRSVKLLKNDSINIIPYYILSDLLISDISSTIFEFLPLDKPIIQAECLSLRLKHKIFSKRFWKRLDVERMMDVDFVYKIVDPSDLYSRVQYSLEYPHEMEVNRQNACKYYLYKNDGKASFRLVNAIEAI